MEQCCKTTTLSHPLFALLIEEHKVIVGLLEKIDLCQSKEELKKLAQDLWDFAELKHHHKEEVLLFKQIYLNPKTREGGPMCGLFFDFHMAEKVKEKIEKITQKPLSEEDHQVDIIKSQSPLNIPMEEHRSGKDLLRFILDSFSKMDLESLKKFMKSYEKIQINHFQKEENCMYPMCASLLTVAEADLIYEKWNIDIVE